MWLTMKGDMSLWEQLVCAVTPKLTPKAGLQSSCGRMARYRDRDAISRTIHKCVHFHKETLNGIDYVRGNGCRQPKVSVSFNIQSVGAQRQDVSAQLPLLFKPKHRLNCGQMFLTKCKPQSAIYLRKKRISHSMIQKRSSYFMLPSAWNTNLQLTHHLSRSTQHTMIAPPLSSPSTALCFVKEVQVNAELHNRPGSDNKRHSQVLIRANKGLAQFATTLNERTKKESHALRDLLVVDPFKSSYRRTHVGTTNRGTFALIE